MPLPSDRIISLIEGALGGRKKLVPTDATLARAYRQAIAEAAARKARSSALDQSGCRTDLHRQAGLDGSIAVDGLAPALAGRLASQVISGSNQIVSEPRRLSASL
jgi:hypothetical protein